MGTSHVAPQLPRLFLSEVRQQSLPPPGDGHPGQEGSGWIPVLVTSGSLCVPGHGGLNGAPKFVFTRTCDGAMFGKGVSADTMKLRLPG